MSIQASNPNITFSQRLARGILTLIGWELTGNSPDLDKYVLVGAPHTSNWDFPFAMLLMFASGIRFNWIGKASLFRPPFGALFRRLGGIPVWRDRSHNFVEQIVEAFERSSRLIIAITPEGTRSKVTAWKSGFYHMALNARVPIVMGFVDYRRKQVGFGPVIYPTSDIQETFAELSKFYADKIGLHPEKQGKIEYLAKE